jgi:HEAT repeat protein
MNEREATDAARRLVHSLQADPPKAVTMAIVRTLGQLNSPVSVDGLRIALQQPDADIREEACRVLARVDSPAALDLLTQVAHSDDDTDVKLAAVRGLGSYRDLRAVQSLGHALDDRDPAVQLAAMESLERVTGEDLGPDVRKWKEVAQNPNAVLTAKRDLWFR